MGSVNNVSKGLTNEQIIALANTFLSETPGGVIDGVNDVFTTLYSYQTGKTELYKNGQQLNLGTDYTESADKEVTLTFPPKVGDVLYIRYILLPS